MTRLSDHPATNRLSDAPTSLRDHSRRDSLVALQGMVDADDLSVVFQPIVDMSNGSLFAYEALVRCAVPRFASPPDLFDHAVESGCTGRLGRMIREIAVPLCAGLPVFLNVHPQELEEGWLVRPDDPVFEHDHDVFLEITEAVPMTHFDLCWNVLKELRSRGGVHLVVDDLGAGYSNLKCISDLEPKVVKLDRGLIAGLDRNARQQRLVASVVQLCKDLGALVVAEGIETNAEFEVLRDSGAHLGQGYLFARPSFPIPPFVWPPSMRGAGGRSEPPTLAM